MLIKEYSYPNNIIRGRSVICRIMNCRFSIRTKRRLYVPKRENRYKNQEGKCTGNSEHNPLPPTHSNGYSFCVLLTIADLELKKVVIFLIIELDILLSAKSLIACCVTVKICIFFMNSIVFILIPKYPQVIRIVI